MHLQLKSRIMVIDINTITLVPTRLSTQLSQYQVAGGLTEWDPFDFSLDDHKLHVL